MTGAPDAPADVEPRRPRRGVGPFSVRHLLAILASVVGVGLLLAIVTQPINVAPPASARPGATAVLIGEPVEGLRTGDLAPELMGTVDGKSVELVDLDGRPVRLADFRGRPVWINFWASWCPPCQAEVPHLRAVSERHPDELVVLGVSVQETSPEEVREYVTTYDLRYPIGFDATAAIFKTYRIFALPTQVFIDHTGVVRHTRNGPVTEAEAEAVVGPLIEAAKTASR
jgi:thiol-disulfide isomerase/thioredoxin